MILAAIVSAIHLLSLAGGVTCIVLRLVALRRPLDESGLAKLFAADNVYGLLSITWIGSGVWRAFGTIEKGSAYYFSNHVFWLKLAALALLMAAEMPCMVTFIRWRIKQAKGESFDTSIGKRLFLPLQYVELVLVFVMVASASLMARGIGVPHRAAQATGAKLYEANCAACHGADGTGKNGTLAANFVGDKARLAKTDETLLRSIALGVPGTAMVGFDGRLSADEQREVLRFVRAQFGGTTPRESP